MSDYYGTVRWFGPSWGAPVCDPQAEIPNPGGQYPPCTGNIVQGNQGVSIPGLNGHRVAFHLRCFLVTLGLRPPFIAGEQ